jgi:hypothetical protein
MKPGGHTGDPHSTHAVPLSQVFGPQSSPAAAHTAAKRIIRRIVAGPGPPCIRKKRKKKKMSNLCANPNCAQYRLQHKNLTIERLDLLREVEKFRRLHANLDTSEKLAAAVDESTGERGLTMPDGEIITSSKLKLRMQVAAECNQRLIASEKNNRLLSEEVAALKHKNEQSIAELRRLERVLSGFEKTRKFELFTDEKHRETLQANEKLAEHVENLEYKLHIMQEELDVLQQAEQRRAATASRVLIDDEDRESISAYITADGRVPAECPCKGQECSRYDQQVVMSPNPADAFSDHMLKYHKVSPCSCCAHATLTPSSACTASSLFQD